MPAAPGRQTPRTAPRKCHRGGSVESGASESQLGRLRVPVRLAERERRGPRHGAGARGIVGGAIDEVQSHGTERPGQARKVCSEPFDPLVLCCHDSAVLCGFHLDQEPAFVGAQPPAAAWPSAKLQTFLSPRSATRAAWRATLSTLALRRREYDGGGPCRGDIARDRALPICESWRGGRGFGHPSSPLDHATSISAAGGAQ